jgi:hypothetical protein
MGFSEISRITELPDEYRTYLQTNATVVPYAEASFWCIATNLLHDIKSKVTDPQLDEQLANTICYLNCHYDEIMLSVVQSNPVMSHLNRCYTADQSSMSPNARRIADSPTGCKRNYLSKTWQILWQNEAELGDWLGALRVGPDVLKDLLTNTRDEAFDDIKSYLLHLRTCCYIRAVVTELLQDEIDERTQFEQLYWNQSYDASKLADWFFPNLSQITAHVKATNALGVISRYVSCIPYDLLAVLDMMRTIAAMETPEIAHRRLDLNQLMDDWADEKIDCEIFNSAAQYLHSNPQTSINIYTDIKGMKFSSETTSDIDDALAILFLRWFFRRYKLVVNRVGIIVCDKEGAVRKSVTDVWKGFPDDRIFYDTADGVKDTLGPDTDLSTGYNDATFNVIIGPVHIKTLGQIFTNSTTRYIGAVTASAGVNGAHSAKEFTRLCNQASVEYVRYNQKDPYRHGGGSQRVKPRTVPLSYNGKPSTNSRTRVGDVQGTGKNRGRVAPGRNPLDVANTVLGLATLGWQAAEGVMSGVRGVLEVVRPSHSPPASAAQSSRSPPRTPQSPRHSPPRTPQSPRHSPSRTLQSPRRSPSRTIQSPRHSSSRSPYRSPFESHRSALQPHASTDGYY